MTDHLVYRDAMKDPPDTDRAVMLDAYGPDLGNWNGEKPWVYKSKIVDCPTCGTPGYQSGHWRPIFVADDNGPLYMRYIPKRWRECSAEERVLAEAERNKGWPSEREENAAK